MRPKAPADDAAADFDMFRHRLDNMLDLRHPLARLAGLIDWQRFDEAFGPLYADKAGRPGLPTRLMAGLHLVKHVKGLSDEEVCAQFVENPYVQFFCGETHFQTRLPIDRSSMTRWRQRIGPERLEVLLAETLAAAERGKALKRTAMERVTVDTTVQTKAVAHPTDSRLLLRGIEWLNRLARKHGVRLRQSYTRVAAHAAREVGRLIHGRGHKQAMRWLRKLRTWLGRLARDITRRIANNPMLKQTFAVALARVERLLGQKLGDGGRLYALHAPEVECIGKGKARTRYEFGVKTSIAVTNACAGAGQFVVGAMTLPGNPYDGHTLRGQISQTQRITGVPVRRAYVDRGYRGHGVEPDRTEVYISHTRGIVSPTIRRELRRRNAIEPVIGHLKSDGLLERNHLKGPEGDAINAILVAAGHNLRLIIAWLRLLLPLITALIAAAGSTIAPAAETTTAPQG